VFQPAPAPPSSPGEPTIGIDLGGTKIEGIVLDRQGTTLAKKRIATPRDDYEATLRAISDVISALEAQVQLPASAHVGLAMPGSISPRSGLVQNANSTWLNGRPLGHDLVAELDRPLRLANDANCLALSEARDGAARGAHSVFGVILGTGCGGGIVVAGSLVDGPRGIGGEWGHNPLPWAEPDEHPGPLCWCGRRGCLETWLSGPGLSADFERTTGHRFTAEQIVRLADRNAGGGSAEAASLAEAALTTAAQRALERHASRLARGLANVINILDPEVIVLGGGLSQLAHLYAVVPELAAPYLFSDDRAIDLRPPHFGDASGARGAARLWQEAPRCQSHATAY